MIKCVIIDDEQNCVDTLFAMLTAIYPDKITVAGTTTDSRKAAALIAEHEPGIVFMDVEMPHINGIQLMHSFAQRNFAVVFTTAYDKYALQALKTEPVDYLLKPVSISELGEAIEKATLRLLQLAPAAVKKIVAVPQKLLLPAKAGLLAANIPDIIRLEANSNYTNFYIEGKPKIVVAKTMKEFEEILVPCGFFRIHNSHLVNLHRVEYLHQGLEEYVILKNGEKVEVSRRRKAELLEKLSSL